VLNIFQQSYGSRLKSWSQLRNQLLGQPLEEICIQTDKWWQYAPLVNHYLHPIDLPNWPNPWELLVENSYCTIARGLGMCYTVMMLDVDNIEFKLGTNEMGENVALVLVDNAKYTMNYWPDSVLSTNLKEFKLTETIDILKIKNKILG
jgi:hypothetical protein